MAQDVTKETLEALYTELDEQLSQEEIKAIIYSAYSYSTAIDDTNVNNVEVLSSKIDWDYFIEKKNQE